MLNFYPVRHISNLLYYKFPLKSLLTIFFVLLMCSGFQADAQLHKDPWLNYGGGGSGSSPDAGYGMSLNAEYDAPTGSLGNTFSPAPSFTLNVLKYFNGFTFNASVGFHSYSPKQPIFYYSDGAGGTATVVYDNFPVYSFYVGAVYNVQLANALRFYAGFNMGAYYARYSYTASGEFGGNFENLIDDYLYVAPKLGFNYMISDQFGLGLEAKYNFFTPEGSKDDNPLVGTFFKSYAGGLVLTYKF
jgi:hypothetical protein